MSKTLVRHEVNLSHLPPLPKQQKAQLGAAESQAESEINRSDIAAAHGRVLAKL